MKIATTFTIQTPNLILRVPHLEDTPHIFSATRYEGFHDGMAWNKPENKSELIPVYYSNLKNWAEGNAYIFTIERKYSCEFLGRIVIRRSEEGEKNAWNLGFWTHPERQGKGIMTEATGAVIDFGFTQLDAAKIDAYHALWNIGSEKVLKKNGMKFVRYIEKGFLKNGKWVKENMLAIERKDWENGTKGCK